MVKDKILILQKKNDISFETIFKGKKRRAMAKLVRKVFQRESPDTLSQAQMPELPEEFYLEEDGSETGSLGRGEHEIPRFTKSIVCKDLLKRRFSNLFLY